MDIETLPLGEDAKNSRNEKNIYVVSTEDANKAISDIDVEVLPLEEDADK